MLYCGKNLNKFKTFRYGVIHCTQFKSGNLLGEEVYKNRKDFVFMNRINGNMLPYLKEGSTGVVWKDLSIYFEIDEVILASIFSHTEITWKLMARNKGNVIGLKAFWNSFGFETETLNHENNLKVQYRNFSNYLNLSKKAKEGLIILTKQKLKTI